MEAPPPVPGGPCGPAGPVGPGGPAGPVEPVAPVAPVAPVRPVGPAGPAGPVAPAGPVEPVAPGTNHAACCCEDVNVLAHPGLITAEEARLAVQNHVALELTSRGGHNRTNGHVACIAREAGCQIVIDSDAHAPHDILDERAKFIVGKGAGLSETECRKVLTLNVEKLLIS